MVSPQTGSLAQRAIEEWERNLCENKAVAILERMQAGRPALIKKDGGEMLIAIVLLWGDIGLAGNMCKFQPHKPGPTQTPCAPPVRELWVACSATQELPTRPSYAPKTLEQKRKNVGTKKAVLEVLGQKKFTLDTQVTHWHTASKRCQPA